MSRARVGTRSSLTSLAFETVVTIALAGCAVAGTSAGTRYQLVSAATIFRHKVRSIIPRQIGKILVSDLHCNSVVTTICHAEIKVQSSILPEELKVVGCARRRRYIVVAVSQVKASSIGGTCVRHLSGESIAPSDRHIGVRSNASTRRLVAHDFDFQIQVARLQQLVGHLQVQSVLARCTDRHVSNVLCVQEGRIHVLIGGNGSMRKAYWADSLAAIWTGIGFLLAHLRTLTRPAHTTIDFIAKAVA
jgi:hypothetical protein